MVEVTVGMVTLGFFIAAFSALFTIMNPLSTASVFLTITKGDSLAKRRNIALKACIAAALVLLAFAMAGNLILYFFGITVDAFRIAGGLLITRVGFGMLYPKKEAGEEKREKEAEQKDDISLIPLAIPMLSGPGAMTTAIVLMGEAGGWAGANYWLIGSVFLAIIGVSALSYVILRQSISIQKYIGENERAVIDKILGLIVMVIGIQFIINGLAGWLSGIFG